MLLTPPFLVPEEGPLAPLPVANLRFLSFVGSMREDQSEFEEHKKAGTREKEDDASKRAFDREKDMGGGMKIGHAKRKEMVGKAADFGSRFSGGKYL